MSNAQVTPARTHAQANELLRRPFAAGAIGFRAMSKTPLGNDPYGGAQSPPTSPPSRSSSG